MSYKKLIFIAVFFALAVSPYCAKAGFGVSPPLISVDCLVRGSIYEQTVFLVQGEPEKNLKIEVLIDADEIKDWITIEGGNEQMIPKGTQQFPLKAIIEVPENAELGKYKGYIRVHGSPEQIEGQQITVALGARIDLDLTVGEGFFEDWRVQQIKILDIEEGWAPQIALKIDNRGNVKAAPERVSFELFNKYGDIRLGFMEVSSGFEKVEAFKISTIFVKFPIDIKLGIGEYWGKATVYKDGKIMKEMKTVFNVVSKGTLVKSSLFDTVKSKSLIWWIGLAILLLIAVALFLFKKFLFKKLLRR